MKLTEAIEQMQRSANSRRIANSDLKDAADLVAQQIIEAGRTGDAVSVSSGARYRIEKLGYGCSQWGNRDWDMTGRAVTLSRNGVVLLDTRKHEHDGNNLHPPRTCFYTLADDGMPDIEQTWATPRVRREFANEAAEAIAAFSEKWATETASSMDAAATLRGLGEGAAI